MKAMPRPMTPRRPSISKQEAATAAIEILGDTAAADERMVKLSLRVPETFRRELKLLATKRGTEMQQLILDAVRAAHPELSL